jgi:hypothetical protein
MKIHRSSLPATAVVIGLLAFTAVGAQPAWSHDRFGFRVGTTMDPDDTFVGAEALLSMGSGGLYFNPNVEYVFRDGVTDLSLNADFHLDFSESSRVFFWVGAGLAGIYTNPDGPAAGHTDPGLNLFTGLGFRAGRVIPYFQPKLVIVDEGGRNRNHGVLTFGIRF